MTNEQRDLEAGYRALAQEWLRDRPHRRGRDHRETRPYQAGRHAARDGLLVTLTRKTIFEEAIAAAASNPRAAEAFLHPGRSITWDDVDALDTIKEAAFFLEADK